MAIEGTIKIMGRQDIYTSEDRRYYLPRYTTSIYGNKEDNAFADKLVMIGCNIENKYEDSYDVILPYQWIHFKMNDKEEVIVDQKGRIRIRVYLDEKVSKFLRRFDFGIELVNIPNRNKSAMRCYLTDMGLPATEIKFSPEEYQKFVNDAGYSQEKLLEIAIEQCGKTLDENVPGWRDDLAYWEG